MAIGMNTIKTSSPKVLKIYPLYVKLGKIKYKGWSITDSNRLQYQK